MTGGFLVIFLMNQFVCGESNQNQQVVEANVNDNTVIDTQGGGKSFTIRKRNRGPQIKFTSWGLDPFAEAYRLVKVDTTPNDSTDFVLKGVIWKGNEAYVLIGDDILKEGEQKGDLKILEIEKDRVVCMKGKHVVTLTLSDDQK